MNNREQFYATCSEILEIDHDYHEPYKRRNRWNARRKGNGRFPGFGLVQDYGGFIRIVSKNGTVILYDYEEVYEYLRKVK